MNQDIEIVSIEYEGFQIEIFKSTKKTFYRIYHCEIGFLETHDTLKNAKNKIDFCLDRGVWK